MVKSKKYWQDEFIEETVSGQFNCFTEFDDILFNTTDTIEKARVLVENNQDHSYSSFDTKFKDDIADKFRFVDDENF